MINVANSLTIGRILVLPFLIACMYSDQSWAIWCAITLYILSALSDFLDGWVARKYNQISAFGTFLDPISDKIFVACILIALVDIGTLSGLWTIPVIVIFTREFLISGLREYLGPHNIQMPVTKLAKWKTTFQMLALGLLVAAPLGFNLLDGGRIALIIAAALTVITGWGYLRVGLDHMRKMP